MDVAGSTSVRRMGCVPRISRNLLLADALFPVFFRGICLWTFRLLSQTLASSATFEARELIST